MLCDLWRPNHVRVRGLDDLRHLLQLLFLLTSTEASHGKTGETMKRLALIAVAALALPTTSLAQGVCRDFRTQLTKSEEPVTADSRVVAVDEANLPSFEFEEPAANGTFAVKGILCGSDLEPLPDRRIELVRYRSPAETRPLKRADLPGLTRLQTYELVSSSDGRFTVSGLPAGDYLLVADWTELPSAYVVYDLRLIPGPSRFSPLSQIGLLQPN